MYFGSTFVAHDIDEGGGYAAGGPTSDEATTDSYLGNDRMVDCVSQPVKLIEEKVIMPPSCSFDCHSFNNMDKCFPGEVITFGDNGDIGKEKEVEVKEEVRGIALRRHKKILSKWVRSLQTCEIGILNDTKDTDEGDTLGLWNNIMPVISVYPDGQTTTQSWCEVHNGRRGENCEHNNSSCKDNFDGVTPTSPLIFTPDEYVEKPYKIDNHGVYTMDSLGRNRPFNMIIPSDGVGESTRSDRPIDTITSIPRGIGNRILTNHSRRRFDGIVQNIHPKLYCQLMEGENIFEDDFYEEQILSPLEIQTRHSNSDVSNHSDTTAVYREKVELTRHRYPILPQANRDASQLRQKVVKTKLCVHQIHGSCPRGRECTFAHSAEELKKPPNFYKTRLCFNYCRTAYCWKGDKCTFAHGLEEIRMAPQEDISDVTEQRDRLRNVDRLVRESSKDLHGNKMLEERTKTKGKEDIGNKDIEAKKLMKTIEDVAERESSGGSTSDADDVDYEDLKNRLLESVPRLGRIKLLDTEFNKVLEEENKLGAVLQRT